MILKQYYLGCLAHASYLIGDETSNTAVVVDPQRDIAQYVDDASANGLKIKHVFLTHFHADFIAGHLELRDRCGALIHLGAKAKAEYEFVPMSDRENLEFPGLRLQTLQTPGHTIESISILVFDLLKDNQNPWAVLTGDTLFIGDVGRPDLRASLGWSAEDLGAHLYDSLHNQLLPLPDQTLIYPAHGAGSLCGKQLSSETVSTLGEQRRLNYALQPMTKSDFVKIVTLDQPDAPQYFTYDAILNTRERQTLEESLSHGLHPINLDEFLRLHEAGAQILDVRESSDFGGGHFRGSVNIGLGGQFATWAGTVLDREKLIVIVAEPGREQEAALRLGRIGFDVLGGYLGGGIAALADRPDLVSSSDRITAFELGDAISSAKPTFILDVRTKNEWETGHIEGSINIPLNHLLDRFDEIPVGLSVTVHCAAGYRSSLAISLLQQRHDLTVLELTGGLAAWDAAKLPLMQV